MKLDLHYLFSTKYAKWIIISLIIFFSLLIISELLSLFFPPRPIVIAKSSDIKITSPAENFNALATSSLFGTYVPDDLNEGNVKKSMLDLSLVGILFSDNTEDSQVIIRTANGEEKNYRVGDTIPGEAVIKRIMANGVLVEHNGTIESLSLPKNDLTFEPIAKPLEEEGSQ